MSFNNSLVGFNDHTSRDFTDANDYVYNVITMTPQRQTKWDDYPRVKLGDIRIEENICTSSVRLDHRNDEEGRKQYRLWRDVDARRNIGIARLRSQGEDKFLSVTYDGPDALKAFKHDFDQFAHIKHAHAAQLFGYNDDERGLPALVFSDALIPLGHIVFDGNRFRPLLFSYFAHQFSRMQWELAVGDLLLGELWVDPRTGALQKGLYLELPSLQSLIMVSISENTMPNTHSTHLPIQAYSDDDTVFEYLIRTFPAQTILKGIRFASTGLFHPLVNEQAIPALSYLPGAIYNLRSRDIIARFPGASERWHYRLWRVDGRIPDGMRESQLVMGDGSVRLIVASTEVQDLQWIELRYSLYPGEEQGILVESWLTQAHGVFSQLGIHEDDWEDYSLLTNFDLYLECTSPYKPKEANIPLHVYLFIRPVPRPSDDKAIWRSWMEGEKYVWCFDYLGREMVPELEQAHLGLPSFTSRIEVLDATWPLGHYNAIQKLHTSKGFDPTVTDFALSLGFPILEVIGDQHRFEDIEELSSNSSRQSEDIGESSSNLFRRFADNLKTRGARFVAKAKVGFGTKESEMADISLGETSSKGLTRQFKDVFRVRRRIGKA